MKARLEVITGPMFSGKTEELLRRLRREEIAGNKSILFKPEIDSRYGSEGVTSHNGISMFSHNVTFSRDMGDFLISKKFDVVGIDEAQFFDPFLIEQIDDFLSVGRKVILCGLDKDFATNDFGPVPRLMVLADRVDKLTSVCNKCGADDASFTQRLVDGKPAKQDGPTILVGGTESYEARCRDCFQL